MKICPKCNVQYPDNKRFCSKCGELLIPDSPIGSTMPTVENKIVKNVDSYKTTSNKRKVLKYVLIGASVVVITVIAVFVILFFKQKSAWNEAKERNTLTSYQEYFDDYPNGRYVEDAKLEVTKINEPLIYDEDTPPPPPPPPDNVVYQSEEVVVEDVTTNSSTDESIDNPIFTVVEEMPSYPGGDEARVDFFTKNIRYPQLAKESGIQGIVYVTFIVNKNGKVSDVKVLRGLGGGCDEEAVRVVKLMPPWSPGKQSGKAVRIQFSMPIRFTLD